MKTREEIENIIPNTGYGLSYNYDDGFIDGYIRCQQDMGDNSKVTRFEVIDDNGRVYTTKDCKVELSYQDDGRTLKVFINSLNK